MHRALRSAIAIVVLVLASSTWAEAQERVMPDTLGIKGEALVTVLRERVNILRPITSVDACSVFAVLGRRADFRDSLPPDVRSLIEPTSGEPCTSPPIRHERLEVAEVTLRRGFRSTVSIATVRLRNWRVRDHFDEETYELIRTDHGGWSASRLELRCCVAGPRATPPGDSVPSGLLVHYVRSVNGPAVILNGAMLLESERDSALATLRNVMLDSVKVYPAGPATERLFGSRGWMGVVILVTKRE